MLTIHLKGIFHVYKDEFDSGKRTIECLYHSYHTNSLPSKEWKNEGWISDEIEHITSPYSDYFLGWCPIADKKEDDFYFEVACEVLITYHTNYWGETDADYGIDNECLNFIDEKLALEISGFNE